MERIEPMDDKRPEIPEAERVKYSRRERATRALQMASGQRCSLCGTLCVTLPDHSYTQCLCTPEDKAAHDAWLNQPQPKDERGWLAQIFQPELWVDRTTLVNVVESSARRERRRLTMSRKGSVDDRARREARIYNLTDLAEDIAEQRIGLREAV